MQRYNSFSYDDLTRLTCKPPCLSSNNKLSNHWDAIRTLIDFSIRLGIMQLTFC